MVLVDSSVWIEAARRQGDVAVKAALRALLDEYEAAWCSAVKLEVLGGARAEERRALAAWFACIPYVECRESDWEAAVALAWRLRDGGLTVPWNDLLIATMAQQRDLRLYARDAHFEAMALKTTLLLYRPGYGGRFEPEEAP